jgi:hypothetical protein
MVEDREKTLIARTAVLQIGTNAIPYLLKMLCEKDSVQRTKLLNLVQKQKLIRIHYKPDWVRNSEGKWGFSILGADAKEAVPALIEVYERNISTSSRGCTIGALGEIGPGAIAAIPTLLQCITSTNTDAFIRTVAVNALGGIHAEASTVVPILINCLSDPIRDVRLIAARSLGRYGTEAREAIPKLSSLLSDKEKSVSSAAYGALRQIDGGKP